MLRLTTLLLLLALVHSSTALKFSIDASPNPTQKCISNHVGLDQLVVVTAVSSGHKGDGQRLDIEIRDSAGNHYASPRDVVGEARIAFTSHANGPLEVCFTNTLTNPSSPPPSRSIDLDLDIGANALDWSAIQRSEHLSHLELELRRLESQTSEVVEVMEYLRMREQRLRDTNESTNERVKYFAIGMMGLLTALGWWQVVYLRRYFKGKHLID
ncbi:hypothetical protein SAICODRAFT_88923 [Saitoella complicata NRRL Y-17804]|uniref:GOLD domain-containing protein n=1 Tax=Saitoella complicata (strain BCRC 22490 / CBS 7301 / JCM 7358 / NBRC 10748 / NRRL Y-17804) TaxID=698492 RepID=A0A0E9NIS9_SAICN|nr:uncharacterized protein SAICODRAFT_88923 [Saitoella complicata NRRL Y-17804]ODQ54879.1 hypothetical protein SAICODRAFT_88923 [Saitoella complicata NRRL Y-17804]GAO49777.1 hypothetical protein G7K_3919-t1 [Saitoella complicata NRRL Y-17804]